MAAFFQKVFMDQTTFDADQTSTADGDRPSMSPVDLAGELVSDTSTCQELAHQAFDFFKVNSALRITENFSFYPSVSLPCAPLNHLAIKRYRWFSFGLFFTVSEVVHERKQPMVRTASLSAGELGFDFLRSIVFCCFGLSPSTTPHSCRWSSAPCRESERLTMVSPQQVQWQTPLKLRHRRDSQIGKHRRTSSTWTA